MSSSRQRINTITILSLLQGLFLKVFKPFTFFAKYYIIPSLTVENQKNRCIPCICWSAAIFAVVMKYSNLFFSFTFFLNGSHFTFGYELIIGSEAADFMKRICDSVPFV